MKLQFIKVSPAENMTIFVLDQVDRKDHIKVANKLLAYGNLYAEQVGFIERSGDHIRLQMMGGEFCGNATRSLAAIMVDRELGHFERDGEDYMVELETSGLEKVVQCRVRKTEEKQIYKSQVRMPLAEAIRDFSINYKGKDLHMKRVDFPGMTHFIVDDRDLEDREGLYKLIKAEMDQEEYDAFGIMYYDEDKNFMVPLVYVRPTDSLYWEKSCGSGTTALGTALAFEAKKDIRKLVHQPGGDLEIKVSWSQDQIDSVYLDGPVDLVAEGIVYI